MVVNIEVKNGFLQLNYVIYIHTNRILMNIRSLLLNYKYTVLIGVVIMSSGNVLAQKNNFEGKAIYVGTYTQDEGHVNGTAEGIYLLKQNIESGDLNLVSTVAEITNPSFIKVSRDGKYLYAVSELGGKDGPTGFIYSYAIQKDYSLKQLNKLPTHAHAPCHIEIDPTGRFVFVSNYIGGVVVVYNRDKNGRLKESQCINLDNKKSHVHSVQIPPSNKFAYINDLGTDKIWFYKISDEGNLALDSLRYVQLEHGAGPRHFTFTKDERFGYSINELNSSITVFGIQKDGDLKILQTINTLPKDFNKFNAAADIHIHPNQGFIYSSNRGHNSIAAFKIGKMGTLQLIGHYPTKGSTPRNFAISPDGDFLYVANQDSNNISSYSINKQSGELTAFKILTAINTPVCLEYVP